MKDRLSTVILVGVMVVVIIVVDVLFFRGRFWARVAANVGIILMFAAFYFRIVK